MLCIGFGSFRDGWWWLDPNSEGRIEAVIVDACLGCGFFGDVRWMDCRWIAQKQSQSSAVKAFYLSCKNLEFNYVNR